MKSLTAALLLAVATLTTGCLAGDPNSNCESGDRPRCRDNAPSYCEEGEGVGAAPEYRWWGVSCGSWTCDDSGDEPVCLPPPPQPMKVGVTAEGCTQLTVVPPPPDRDSVALDISHGPYTPQTPADLNVDEQGRRELSVTDSLVLEGEILQPLDLDGDPPTYQDDLARDDVFRAFIVRVNEHVSFRGSVVSSVGDLHLAEVLICPEGEGVRPVFTFHPDGQWGPVSGLKVSTVVDGVGVAEAGPVDLMIR